MITSVVSLDPHISKTPIFPKEGITFYDISPALENGVVLCQPISRMAVVARKFNPDVIAGLMHAVFCLQFP